jgi:hypothetical protein
MEEEPDTVDAAEGVWLLEVVAEVESRTETVAQAEADFCEADAESDLDACGEAELVLDAEEEAVVETLRDGEEGWALMLALTVEWLEAEVEADAEEDFDTDTLGDCVSWVRVDVALFCALPVGVDVSCVLVEVALREDEFDARAEKEAMNESRLVREPDEVAEELRESVTDAVALIVCRELEDCEALVE